VKTKAFFLSALSCWFLVLSFSLHAQVSFLQPPSYSGTGGVFTADFNGDGKPDLLTSDGTINLGNGQGTFTTGTQVAVPDGLQVLAVADFNGDGRPDLLAQGTGTLLVLLGNGDGTFQPAISTSIGVTLALVAEGDLNRDGKADVAGICNGVLLVYISNGNGTFKAATSYSLGSTSAAVLSLADFNGDNRPDIVVSTSGQEIVLLGNGDGTFQTPKVSAGVQSSAFGAVGDFNGDRKLDLVVSSCNTFGLCSVYVLLGNGDGTFQAPTTTGVTDSGALAAEDFNGDGKLDLVLLAAGCEIYLGNGDGTFSAIHTYALNPLGPQFSTIAIADFNADGKLDVAVTNTVLLGNGNGTFQGNPFSTGNFWAPDQYGAVVGDFDNNGIPDVAVASLASVFILTNDGTGALSVTQTYTLQQGWFATIVTGDFNGDGNLDLVAFDNSPGGGDPPTWYYSVLLGNGDGTFQPPVLYQQGYANRRGAAMVVVGDFNNDGKLDFAEDFSDVMFLGNGDGTFGAPIPLGQGASYPVSADFNGDGNLDIAVGGLALLFGNGDGSFQAPVFPQNLQDFTPLFTADLNKDGKPDLILASPSGSSQVALGNGDGTFALLPPVFPQVIAIGDLNGDGRLDAVARPDTNSFQLEAMLGNGDSTFGSPLPVPAATDAYQEVLIADMNGDGLPDLVLVRYNGVAVLLNTTAPGFELSAGAVSPAAVVAGNSGTSAVAVIPTFGFNKAVTLSCGGLPSGISCAFSPPSIANSSGTSTLTIATAANTSAGTYSIRVQGTAGSVVNTAAVSLVVQAVPDFELASTSGTSQTISVGQSASFNLNLSPSGSFTGTVDLTCSITPAVTPPPVCRLSSSSVQISGGAAQSVTATVATTGSAAVGAMSIVGLPPETMASAWTLMLLGAVCLVLRSKKRFVLPGPVLLMAVLSCLGCGGSGGSSRSIHTGTPAGTYTATVTATSGNVSHNTALTVVVQ
jgi:FG-GAP-like repeat/FG-GAP repeat